jgi:hypothetical protein
MRANDVGAKTETRANFEGWKNKHREGNKRLPSHYEHEHEHKQRDEREVREMDGFMRLYSVYV